jgi:hypothetical protein
MVKRKFRVGDKVKVVGMSPVTFPPGVKDELGTEKLFKSMLGKVYTVRGFDEYGNVDLEPKRLNTVWVEPEFLKLRARKTNKGKPECEKWRSSPFPVPVATYIGGSIPPRASKSFGRFSRHC